MLLLFRRLHGLDFRQLTNVYAESLEIQGKDKYAELEPGEQVLRAEQDLYQYLPEMMRRGGICAVWASEGRYLAALRLERYRDGLLLTALETAPNERRKGYAGKLVSEVLEQFFDTVIYAHVHHNNALSAALHKKCGFVCIKESAVFLDGSVSAKASTYMYDNGRARSE